MEEQQKRKLLRALCHAGALTSWTGVAVGIPIAILFISDDQLVLDSAKEAINFSITLFLWAAAAGVLWFTIIGIPLALLIGGITGLAAVILPIIAIVSVCTNPVQPYRYPFTVRLLKSNTLSKVG